MLSENQKDEMEYLHNICREYDEFVLEVLSGAEKTRFDEMFKELFRDSVVTLESKTTWYRARKHNNRDEGPFNKENIGMNKNINHTNLGRCNYSGEKMFYLSENIKTTFCEINSSSEDLVSVGEFQTILDKKVVYVTDGMLLNTIGCYGGYNSRTARLLNAHMINRHFRKENEGDYNEIYLVTSYISNLLRTIGIDGIKYKSVKDKENGINIALIGDDCMEWKKTKQYLYFKPILEIV